jgi:hypothetical protein
LLLYHLSVSILCDIYIHKGWPVKATNMRLGS